VGDHVRDGVVFEPVLERDLLWIQLLTRTLHLDPGVGVKEEEIEGAFGVQVNHAPEKTLGHAGVAPMSHESGGLEFL
jgi:hypothetical protein